MHAPVSTTMESISWLDAFFTAVSAVCVTGLVVVDTGTDFTRFGQSVILGLIQLGGLGIMTYTSLVFYLWRKKVSLMDRISVGSGLLHDPTFHLGRFLFLVVISSFIVEALGAILLYSMDPVGFAPFRAIFHSVSAYCNAGFALQPDSLMHWSTHSGINMLFMFLIITGGIGFTVINETVFDTYHYLKGKTKQNPIKAMSFHSRVVVSTTVFLILFGAVVMFLAEYESVMEKGRASHYALIGLFQSVTARTAGFNTVEIGGMTNISLVILMGLMLIGGSPGSCAGGIKTTTFRTLAAFIGSQFKGREQTVIRNRAVNQETLNKALTLTIFSMILISVAVLVLTVTEGGARAHPQIRGEFMELLFEAVSAFGTVGLSTGVTPTLSPTGKLILMVLMFTGRLGPILFLTFIRSRQQPLHYSWPEEGMMIG